MTSREQGKRRATAVTAGLAVTAIAVTAGFGLAARDATQSARATSTASSADNSSTTATTSSNDDHYEWGDDNSSNSSSNASGTSGQPSVSPSNGAAQASTGGS